MTVTNQQASPSPTIEDMAGGNGGIDALFDILDTNEHGHPDEALSGDLAPKAPAEEDPAEDDESEEELDSETEDGSEETTDSDETPDDDVPVLELETTQVEQLFGLDEDSVSVEEDGTLSFKTNIDGEQGTVHLQDLVANYQIKGHLTKQSQKFAEEKDQAIGHLQQQAQALSQSLDSAEALTQAMRERLVAQNQAIDWEKLRTEDPAEYAAKRQELGEQYRQIDGYLSGIQTQREQQSQQSYAEQQQRMQTYLQDQHQQLLTTIPTWNDAKVRTKEMGDIKLYLASKGFTPEEISNISDSRHVLILRDAMRAGVSDKKVKAVKKKIAAIPKVVKPGARLDKGHSRRTSRKQALKRQRNQSTRESDAAAMFELLGDDL